MAAAPLAQVKRLVQSIGEYGTAKEIASSAKIGEELIWLSNYKSDILSRLMCARKYQFLHEFFE